MLKLCTNPLWKKKNCKLKFMVNAIYLGAWKNYDDSMFQHVI